MAPLVPDILSPEFSFVIAFLVGIGFGFALEQAGFSSTRKLVGLFYGYDFTVLKVFFTAGVTALTGVLLLSHFGLLDIGRVYVNPTFVHAALVGGGIMGAGFIVGGFCPGTSICAAAVGRLDAFAFIGGGIIGIFLFMEGYPWIEDLYHAGFIGNPRINEVLAMSPEAFAILLAAVAITAFYVTGQLEDRIRGHKVNLSSEVKKKYAIIGVVPFVLLIGVWLSPSSEERLQARIETRVQQAEWQGIQAMDVDELAFQLVHHAHKYNVIDVRDTSAYRVSVPTAINIPMAEMMDRGWQEVYRQPYKRNVFVGDSADEVAKAAITAHELGDEDPIMLRPSVGEFRQIIFNARLPEDADKLQKDRFDFYQEAAIQLQKLEERLKMMRSPVQKKEVVVKGGCA